ncbi:MAG: DoxX family protein [Gammaproteobacteria bacterium]|nr:DoxX family protein [Gammaproteobacteria bacterium]
MKLFALMRQFGPLVGRVLLAGLFIIAGVEKLMGFDGTAAVMASKGLPMVNLLLVATILIELGGGLLIALGWQARWGALAIFLFIIPVTLVFHAFWTFEGAEHTQQVHSFLKNLAIMGGMLYIMAAGSGPYSLGARD